MKVVNIDWTRVFRVRRVNNSVAIRFVDNCSWYRSFDSTEECGDYCEALIADAKKNKINITIEGHGDLVYDG